MFYRQGRVSVRGGLSIGGARSHYKARIAKILYNLKIKFLSIPRRRQIGAQMHKTAINYTTNKDEF